MPKVTVKFHEQSQMLTAKCSCGCRMVSASEAALSAKLAQHASAHASGARRWNGHVAA